MSLFGKLTGTATTVAAVPPGFAEAWRTLEASDVGYPPLTGAAAAARAALDGTIVPPVGTTYPGKGRLAAVAAQSDVAVILTLASEVKSTAAVVPVAVAEAPPALLPPDAPEPAALIATPPPDAIAAEIAAPKKRGRPPGAAKPPTDAATPAAVTGGITLYVDCVEHGIEAQSLAPWVDAIAAALASEHKAHDVRCAPNDGPLGFGRWRGALAALCRTAARTLAPGAYHLDSRGDLNGIAAEALRSIVDRYIGGVR